MLKHPQKRSMNQRIQPTLSTAFFLLCAFPASAWDCSNTFAQSQEPGPERVLLWPSGAPNGDGTTEAVDVPITIHRPSPQKANGAAVIICPGGGYGGLVTGGEGHGIAKWLTQHGITGIVLEYRLPRGRAFVPLLDAQRAIRTVRANANKWGIKPDRIGIIGFSAGGHLAATAVTHFDAGDLQAEHPIERESSRPDFDSRLSGCQPGADRAWRHAKESVGA